MNLNALLPDIVSIAKTAGEAILEVYDRDSFTEIQIKADNTPVTEADFAANQLICRSLAALTPQIPVLSEESALPTTEERHKWDRFWLVDPLDGTKEFIKRNGEFTVNIALIDHGKSCLGVVHIPVSGTTYTGVHPSGHRPLATKISADGNAQEITAGRLTSSPMSLAPKSLRVVTSRSHTSERLDHYIQQLELRTSVIRTPIGSSIKLCLLAEGEADIHVRIGRTSEWDTAAAQAVLEAAGGQLMTMDFKPFLYNQKADLYNPDFIAVGDRTFPWHQYLPETSST